jgi:iron complex outermembrane recepter protein
MTMTVRLISVSMVALSVTIPAVAQQQNAQPQLRLTVPTVIVTAQKEPADGQTLPVSVTAVSRDDITDAGITTVSDAAMYAPNTYFTEFTARALSFPRFRGIGTSPANPGITTYIDGVPQLNTNSSSIEFQGIEQVEFVRGAQSALFGRNTLGGVVSIVSSRPSLTAWTGNASVPLGNFDAREVRAGISGPLFDKVGVGFAFGRHERDGFTTNQVTGNDVDYRSATFWKAQGLWTPAANWEAQAIVSGERARDGDLALNDLAALRSNPFRVARDFEGRNDRDILSTTLLARHVGSRFTFTSTTGFVRWDTEAVTDLDYTPLPLVTRDNAEEDNQFSQEVRFASAPNTSAQLFRSTPLRWQSGVFFFTQNYDQNAVNSYAAGLIPQIPFASSQYSPRSALDDIGFGVYGQGTMTFRENLDLAVGARFDYESKEASLDSSFLPPLPPSPSVTADESFSNVSPQFSLSYRFEPNRMAYVSVGRGFKAGGFNPASPPGSEAYGEELTWHTEGGVKTTWADGRVVANAAVFYIDWADMQLNLPNPFVPAQFYIANVGGARSTGVELELDTRPWANFDLFGMVGFTNGRFKDGSQSSGVDVSDNELPNTPGYTASLGAQQSWALGPRATLYGRAEAVFYGGFQYDEANTAGQEAYSLASFRGGVRWAHLFAEGWVRNAFDTRYIPIAFPYAGFAPSGFVGENGPPRTFGFTGGVSF